MDFKKYLSRYGAYLVAAVVFIAVSLAYCFPVLSGKVVFAGDSTQARAAVQESVNYTEQTGDHSWWTGSMFSGMPNYQIGGGEYKSSKLIAPLERLVHKGHWHTEWIFIIYLFCFFVLLRSFDVDKWLSIIGAIAITLSSYFIVIIAAGHNSKTSTIALMSVVLAGFHLIFRKKYGLGVILAMVFTAVGYGAHPQMSYYMFMLIGLLWIGELWQHIREKRMRDFIVATMLFFAATGIGLGTTCASVFATKEYASETMRGGHSDLEQQDGDSKSPSNGLDLEYATQWSYGIDETMSFMIPGFMGGSSAMPVSTHSKLYESLVSNGLSPKIAREFCLNAPIYWGDQPFTSGNVYMGAIICFLFLLGLLIVEGPYKWMLLLATIFSTMLAWGHNFMWFTELFFKYFPLYSKFRAVSSILIVAEIAMPLLGFLAIKAIMDGKVDQAKAARSVLIAGGITAGICLFFTIAGPSLFTFVSQNDAESIGRYPDWLISAILGERSKLLVMDSLRSALLIAAAAATMWFWIKGKLHRIAAIAILGVLIVGDLWTVDKRYFNDRNFVSPKEDSSVFEMLPYEKDILEDEDIHFRVMNLTTSTFNDARTSYYLKSVGGYCAAKLRRYQDLIDRHLSKVNLPVLGMLNTKYLIAPGDNGAPEAMLNPEVMGNAWFVKEIEVVNTPDQEIDELMEIDLKTTAVMDSSFLSAAKVLDRIVPEDASVKLTSYTPKALDYVSESSEDGTVVFSEIYYPYGWKATIDGVPAEHFRVNYILRALNVPAGKHDIHFEFDPDSVRKGDNISMAFIILMYLVTALIIGLGIWKRAKSSR